MDEQEREVFGVYLRRLRDRNNLSLRDVEAEVGISASHLSQIERGEKNPPKQETVRRLARLYRESENAVLVAAGYPEIKTQQPTDYQLDRAFRYIQEDPAYVSGTHMNTSTMTPEAKRFVIEIYSKATGIDLLAQVKKNENK